MGDYFERPRCDCHAYEVALFLPRFLEPRDESTSADLKELLPYYPSRKIHNTLFALSLSERAQIARELRRSTVFRNLGAHGVKSREDRSNWSCSRLLLPWCIDKRTRKIGVAKPLSSRHLGCASGTIALQDPQERDPFSVCRVHSSLLLLGVEWSRVHSTSSIPWRCIVRDPSRIICRGVPQRRVPGSPRHSPLLGE
ncbi:hypothetical protein KSP40_PGU008640 [Platanthera guangdongensis]|uniref:Uncharacterized protein n=1 Tax=Platanthera guangdongensis TaxID=2320717 RepID=A0ABR2LJ59_9ASPA